MQAKRRGTSKKVILPSREYDFKESMPNFTA
jgi:hypothetical protein